MLMSGMMGPPILYYLNNNNGADGSKDARQLAVYVGGCWGLAGQQGLPIWPRAGRTGQADMDVTSCHLKSQA